MALAALAALAGFATKSLLSGGSNNTPSAQTAANDTMQNTGTGDGKSKAKQYLLSQNPTSGYGSNSINTAKSFLLS
jgi:hypothetical protein